MTIQARLRLISIAAFALASPLNAGPPATAAPDSRGVTATPPAAGLTVHEWGTFTNFQGSDGEQLRFAVRVGDDLPDFVYGPDGRNHVTDGTWIKEQYLALNRMETPVIYFYAPMPIHAKVEIGFSKGAFSEMFPAPSWLEQREPGAGLGTTAQIRWDDLLVTPAPSDASGTGSQPPMISRRSHYGAARAVDGSFVVAKTPLGEQAERFVFYRGLSDASIPVKVRALGKGSIEFASSATQATGEVFVVEISAGTTRFRQYPGSTGTQQLRLPDGESSQEALAVAMRTALVKAGLFEKEAAAMVETWRSLWFGEPGTRILYVLPETVVNSLLPLKITPAAETKRVFVGRMDLLTPEAERELLDAAEAAVKGDRARMEAICKASGRFAGPVTQRAAAVANTPAQRDAVRRLGWEPQH